MVCTTSFELSMTLKLFTSMTQWYVICLTLPHCSGVNGLLSQDPIRDLETIMYELCRKDQAYIQGVKERKEAELKRDPKKKPTPAYYSMMDKVDEM